MTFIQEVIADNYAFVSLLSLSLLSGFECHKGATDF